MTAYTRFASLTVAAYTALTLAAPAHAITGDRYAYPIIGTPAYDAGCVITQEGEDGSAYAYCAEDGATYFHDPDGQYVPNIPGNPVREPGWYPVSE